MPTPIGHAVGGLAAAFLVDSLRRRPALTWPLLAGCTALAVAPDLDILAGSHRTASHSIGAMAVVFLVAIVVRWRQPARASAAATLAAAAGSHTLLDWLGKDSSPPLGMTALWPFTDRYYVSNLDLFGEVSRRYWNLHEFVIGNGMAVAWEVFVLLPVLLLAWAHWSRRTVRSAIQA